MNSWGDQYTQLGMQAMMPNMGMPMMNYVDQNRQENQQMMPGQGHPAMQNTSTFIGPVQPELNNELVATEEQTDSAKTHSRRSRGDRGKRRRSRSRSRRSRSKGRRSRSRDRHSKDSRNKDRVNRRTKWGSAEKNQDQSENMGANMLMPVGGMMQYNPMIGNMMGQSMDMMNMGQQMPMMPNMMDQNMVMMNQQMMMANQPLYFTSGVFLSPLPNTATPNRRSRPPGCRTIFVVGLPKGMAEDNLREIFQRFGGVSEVEIYNQGFYHIRFDAQESVEHSFSLTGYRFRLYDQTDNEAITVFIDYALNNDDQNDFERSKKSDRNREPNPLRYEPLTPANLVAVTEKIKSEDKFSEGALILAAWLERGECNKKNANQFYSLVQATNNQVRRLFSEKMLLDEELQTMKNNIKEKFSNVLIQFEQVAKILTVATHQRVSDHFTKHQRRNIDMWLKMTEEVENIKEEFTNNFEDEDFDKNTKDVVPLAKYENLKIENEGLVCELEGYKNEAFLAKEEAERKFEKFKAHFIAEQALKNKQNFSSLPMPPVLPPKLSSILEDTVKSQTPTTSEDIVTSSPIIQPTEAKLISIITAFLLVHPRGASLDYIMSYVKSMGVTAPQTTVKQVLEKFPEVFSCTTSGVGANIETRWRNVTFVDLLK